MFGYACDETDVLMPAPITYAHRLVQRQSEVRKNGQLTWLRPDAKSQVTLRYENGVPTGIDAVVLSTQHAPEVAIKDLQEAVMEHVLKPVLPADWLANCPSENIHINPTGNFVIGGPVGDCGLTGRKLLLTQGGTLPRMWSRPVWRASVKYRSLMRSVLPARRPSQLTPLAPVRFRTNASSNWSPITLIYVRSAF